MERKANWFIRYPLKMVKDQRLDVLKDEWQEKAGHEATLEVTAEEVKIVFDESKPIKNE